MTKVLSTRLSDEAIDALERGAKVRGMTKRQFLEEAIRLRAKQDELEARRNALAASFGTMKRDEPVEETVRKFREWSEQEWQRHWDEVDASDQPTR